MTRRQRWCAASAGCCLGLLLAGCGASSAVGAASGSTTGQAQSADASGQTLAGQGASSPAPVDTSHPLASATVTSAPPAPNARASYATGSAGSATYASAAASTRAQAGSGSGAGPMTPSVTVSVVNASGTPGLGRRLTHLLAGGFIVGEVSTGATVQAHTVIGVPASVTANQLAALKACVGPASVVVVSREGADQAVVTLGEDAELPATVDWSFLPTS